MEARGSKLTLPISEAFAAKLFTGESHREVREFNGTTENRLVWVRDPMDDSERWVEEDWPQIPIAFNFIDYITNRVRVESGYPLFYIIHLNDTETTIQFRLEVVNSLGAHHEPAFEVYGIRSAVGVQIVVDCLRDGLPARMKEIATGLVRGLKLFDARAEGRPAMESFRQVIAERNVVQDPLRPAAHLKQMPSESGPPAVGSLRRNLGNAVRGRRALPEDVIPEIQAFLGDPRNAGPGAALARLLGGGRRRGTWKARRTLRGRKRRTTRRRR